jgi:formamidopyrimidine-DNA glycosylase
VPELPEVETVRRGLQPAMQDQTILRTDIRRPDLRWPFPENMAARLTGKTVTQLRRRSKYILVDLSSGETLIIHLGMSGRMLITSEQPSELHNEHTAPQKHDHVVFDMSGGARVTFSDPRRFGAMDLAPTQSLQSHWLIEKLGPEPLGNSFDETYLADQLARRNTPIKTALLDQRMVAGLGNIYVCEVLHRAKLSPIRKANQISKARAHSLVPIIRQVLQEAIAAGGSSLRDHRQTNGDLGYFQHTFAVYDREKAACPSTGCGGIITRIVQSGRSSFYCPSCQR